MVRFTYRWCRRYNMVHLERYKALEFLEKVGVIDGEALLSEDPLAFLNTLIPAFMTHLPFQVTQGLLG